MPDSDPPWDARTDPLPPATRRIDAPRPSQLRRELGPGSQLGARDGRDPCLHVAGAARRRADRRPLRPVRLLRFLAPRARWALGEPRVAATLDRHAVTWTAMRRQACEATARREQSEAPLDLRMEWAAARESLEGALRLDKNAELELGEKGLSLISADCRREPGRSP